MAGFTACPSLSLLQVLPPHGRRRPRALDVCDGHGRLHRARDPPGARHTVGGRLSLAGVVCHCGCGCVQANDFQPSLCTYYLPPPPLETAAQRRHYSSPVDLWSVGILLYECLAGFSPFYPYAQVRSTIGGGNGSGEGGAAGPHILVARAVPHRPARLPCAALGVHLGRGTGPLPRAAPGVGGGVAMQSPVSRLFPRPMPQADPAKRLTAAEARAHEWFAR